MAFNNEIEKTKKEIEVLTKKLSFLEELSKTKSPVEEAYKDWWGDYPSGTSSNASQWVTFQAGYNAAYEEKVSEEPEENEWKLVALRLGEKLSDNGPGGYYDFTPGEWFEWALNECKKEEPEPQKWDVVRESLKWHKEHPNESVEDYLTPKTPEKRKIDDLAEKLLPDDHPYKIADEHGETNPYKQYLNSVEDEKKMEKLGFVKNSDGHWTARPLDWVKPQTPKETEQSLKEAFVKAQQTEKWKEIQKKIDAPAEGIYDNIDVDKLLKKWEENPPEFLKFELGKTLEDRIYKWWETCFVQHPEWSMEECVEDLLDIIELFLPHFQSAAGSQSLGVEELVEGFNDCLRKIKSKLRNKKDT